MIERKYIFKEVCKGCIMSRSEYSACLFVKKEREDLCPCINCLVKVICQETCEERKEGITLLVGVP